MKYLESSIRFSIKNWMLILPLFVLTALTSLLSNIGGSVDILNVATNLIRNVTSIKGPGDVFTLIPSFFSIFAITSGIWALLIQLVSFPLTYGLINKNLETGSASLNDIGAVLNKNFTKYLMYFLGKIVVSLVIGIGCFILLFILSLLVLLLKFIGVLLLIIIGLALTIAYIIFSIFISMWFTSMVVDELDVVTAFKTSIEVVKDCFLTVLGITILVSIAAGIAGMILGFLSFIPLLGPIIYSVVPTAQTFIMAVFLLMLYRDKTGKANQF